MTGTTMFDRPWVASELQARCTRELRDALQQRRAVALFGAGQTGRLVAGLLGDAVQLVLDDTPAKAGTLLLGKPVVPVDEGLRQLPEGALVIVCIFSAGHQLARTRARLVPRPDLTVCSFAQALHLHPQCLPNLFLDRIDHQLAQRPRYERLHRCLSDERSRAVLDAHLRVRLLGDFDCRPDRRDALDFLGLTAWERPSFVDGGAFDGDSLRDFLAWRGDHFARVVAFEPDAANHARLRAHCEGLAPSIRARIELRHAALWSARGKLAFDATGTVGSALSRDGATCIAAECLAELGDLPDPVIVKLDVEGAEAEVLAGAREWIRRRRPVLAVSAYHRPNDLLDLFEMIDAFGLPYRYHLRCHGGDGTDLMLYAVDGTVSRMASTTASTIAESI